MGRGRPKGKVRINQVIILFSVDEFARVKMLFARSTCRTVSGYLRKVSLEEPVRTITRNGSFDAFIEEIVALRRQMMNLYEQGQWSAGERERLILLHEEIRVLINKIADLCMRQ